MIEKKKEPYVRLLYKNGKVSEIYESVLGKKETLSNFYEKLYDVWGEGKVYKNGRIAINLGEIVEICYLNNPTE